MLVRWTQPAADDLLHICDYTPQNVSARRRPAVWQTRSMKPPPRCKTCRTVDEKAASPTRGKCLSPASRSSLFTASDKKRLRSPVSCTLRSNGPNRHVAKTIRFATSLKRKKRPTHGRAFLIERCSMNPDSCDVAGGANKRWVSSINFVDAAGLRPQDSAFIGLSNFPSFDRNHAGKERTHMSFGFF
jgi:hypothetical protein